MDTVYLGIHTYGSTGRVRGKGFNFTLEEIEAFNIMKDRVLDVLAAGSMPTTPLYVDESPVGSQPMMLEEDYLTPPPKKRSIGLNPPPIKRTFTGRNLPNMAEVKKKLF